MGGGFYDKGVSATIGALASSGYLFGGWGGDASGSSNPLSITMDQIGLLQQTLPKT